MTYLKLFLFNLSFILTILPNNMNLFELKKENPFEFDLDIKIIKCQIQSKDVTICCHGYGSNNSIVDVINYYNNLTGYLIGFNFPDYNITSKTNHFDCSYGTPKEILPLIYILKRCVCDLKLSSINLYGFSAGGGAIINALDALINSKYDTLLKKFNILPNNKKEILQVLEKGIVILDCPLKSIDEIIAFRGSSKELRILSENYKNNNMIPIDVLNNLTGINLNIILNFQKPDEILSNRDDQLFIERISEANKGKTIISISNDKGHNYYHKKLWQNYKNFIKKNKRI